VDALGQRNDRTRGPPRLEAHESKWVAEDVPEKEPVVAPGGPLHFTDGLGLDRGRGRPRSESSALPPNRVHAQVSSHALFLRGQSIGIPFCDFDGRSTGVLAHALERALATSHSE